MTNRRTRLWACCLLVCSIGCGGSATVSVASTAPASGDEAAATSIAPTSGSGARPTETPVASADARPAPAAEVAPWAPVQNPHARYIVAVGLPTAHDDSVRPEHLAHARLHAAHTLQAIEGVELAPPHFDHATLTAETTRRHLGGYVLECAVVHHDVDARGTHFAVNVTVLDSRTADVVAALSGRATLPGPTSQDAEEAALEGALDSAFRGLPVVFETRD